MAEIIPIPGPMGLPFLGNALSLMGEETPILGFERLADMYGPIYQLTIKGTRTIVVSSAAILEELVDEKRFRKVPPLALADDSGARGLFAAASDDPDWGQAHRILTPPMGPLSIDKMFDDMKDIANQLILKWARKGPEDRILLTDDFTRLTLDTIALCTMKYRFNSFYSAEMHPYVDAMLNVLQESGARSTRPAIISSLLYAGNIKRLLADEAMLKKTAQEIIDNRRTNPTNENDLLNAMIYGKDPKTGQTMRDELIAAQMTTFLIAGHETTSGLLSFTFLYLLKNGPAYLTAQKEVDDVLGKRPICPADLKNLKYLSACLREALRLSPTATALSKQINPETKQEFMLLGGRYKVESSDRILVLLGKTQKDVTVYGEDAAEFRPERMLDQSFDKLPNGAWKPFGNGTRACIGRPFAWQEALMVAALILQHFNLRLDDSSYELRIKQTLTIKPKDLFIRTTLRDGMDATSLDRQLHSTNFDPKDKLPPNSSQPKPTTPVHGQRVPITILYGSNTGTCLALAQRLSSDAVGRGFEAKVMDMDSAIVDIHRGQSIIIITPSYEGEPPDNGTRFMHWLQEQKRGFLDGVNFAVFGCGHKDWAKTFHRIPKLADKLMEEAGAQRIVPIGLSDVAQGNVFGDFEDWEDDVLWPRLTSKDPEVVHLDSLVNVEISTNARASSLRHDVVIGTVKDIKVLTADGQPTKRHMEVQLPSDSNYECGDYLAILPLNSEKSVQRIMTHFDLPWDAVITLRGDDNASIFPKDTPLSIYDLLRSYVELSQPATKGALKLCVQYTDSIDDKIYLEKIALDSDLFKNEIIDKRISIFDILYHRASISLPFATFLGLLPPLRVRQYSISSSPLLRSDTCTITYSCIHKPALSDPSQIFEGVASAYLSSLTKGSKIQVSLRTSNKKTFRIPADEENTPLLMFAAGTGLAPFRGFLQHRALQLSAHPTRKLAQAVLFLGCRSETMDRLYASEMDQWVKDGVVDVRYAFSQEPEKSEGCRYVHERMRRDADLLRKLWDEGARVYVCGGRVFDKGVGEAAREVAVEGKLKLDGTKDRDMVEKDIDTWFADVASLRIATDVFD